MSQRTPDNARTIATTIITNNAISISHEITFQSGARMPPMDGIAPKSHDTRLQPILIRIQAIPKMIDCIA